jgi:hypothetical protein
MASALTVGKTLYFFDGTNWIPVGGSSSGSVDYSIVSSASAYAYSSASAYVNDEINALTTSDIEEGSNLYYTELRSLNTASTAFVHNNHTNITATYNSASSQIILSSQQSISLIDGGDSNSLEFSINADGGSSSSVY